MSDTRAQTSDRLATLDAFLDSQRQLLARTQSDLHKLADLRDRALEDPEAFIENADEELDNPAFKWSECEPTERPEGIGWDLFTSLDPSPFASIPIPGPPLLSTAIKQRSAPSELQNFVREASKNILGDFRPFVPSDVDESQDTEADAANEQRLAELVRFGKMNYAQSTSKPDASESPLQRRRVGSALRLTRGYDVLVADSKGKGKADKRQKVEVNVVPTSPQVRLRPQRVRKPRVRGDEIYQASPPAPPSSSPSPDLPHLPAATFGSDVPEPIEGNHSDDSLSVHDGNDVTPKTSKAQRHDARKQRGRNAPSQTFNLPWSLSEQHLLEKLLEEIPAGEKQRWAKISKAMAGKRTPRQVASRVQKYFEKLKKFGVEPS